MSCQDRVAAEAAPEVDAASEDWRYWYRKFLEAMGIAQAEVQKRVTTADCIDAYNASQQ